MLYIEVENSKIKNIYSGKMPSDGKDYRQVPMSFPGTVGQDVAEFDDEWELRPLEDRLRAKLIPDAERYKAQGEELVPKSLPELVRDGIEQAPTGQKLDLSGTEPALVPMTREELVAAGQLAEAEAHRLDLGDEERGLLASLASTDWYVARFAETAKAVPVDIATERQAARDRISAIRAELAG